MGERLDRERQLDVMQILAVNYPNDVSVAEVFGAQTDNSLRVNLGELQSLGLFSRL